MMKLAILALLLAASSFGADLWPFGGSGGNATKIRGVNVKTTLGCTDGQILKYVAANTQFECQNDAGGVGSGDVEGGTNLTTGGRMVGVSSAGTLTEYSDFTRSAAGRYTLYDATATTGVTTLTVRAGAGQSTTNLQSWQNSSGTALATVSSTGGFQGANFVNSSGNIGIGSSSLVLGSAASIGFSSTTNWFGTADLGFTRSSANNLGITNGSSTTYWTLGAGGILAGTDNTYDIGASGANRPRDIWLGRNATVGNLLTVAFLNGSTDGILRLSNAAGSGFTRLQFGGTTSSFPAWSRSSTTLAARLADDSADAPISASNVSASADFIGATTSFHYWGATGSDGSWRMGLDSGNMVIQKRESGSWVTKQTIAP